MEDNNRNDKQGEVDLFHLLPEGCVAHTVSLTTPRDACRLSAVASTVRSVSDSDSVWAKYLPDDYKEVLARSVDDHFNLLSFASKKELYMHLCDHPVIIDKGSMSFSLDKFTGMKCFMLSARNLVIGWGDRYWKWKYVPESRFSQVAAELDTTCWLEIDGTIKTEMLSRNAVYAAYLVYKWRDRDCGFDNTYQNVSVGVVGVDPKTRAVRIDSEGKERGDGWLEIELGEYAKTTDNEEELQMSLVGSNAADWRSGLIVQGIEMRPKAVHT